MSADNRTPHTDALDSLGRTISSAEKRDAIHLAVENVIAAETLAPGDHIGFLPCGRVGRRAEKKVGIVDPFIDGYVDRDERFWLVVYPRQITSLRHVWSHPDFPDTTEVKLIVDARPALSSLATHRAAIKAAVSTGVKKKAPTPAPAPPARTAKDVSEEWMRAWAVEHMGRDYYGDGNTVDEQHAYDSAIRAGHDNYVGPYESAGEAIDDVWWNHWEAITGEVGSRDHYFSCGC